MAGRPRRRGTLLNADTNMSSHTKEEDGDDKILHTSVGPMEAIQSSDLEVIPFDEMKTDSEQTAGVPKKNKLEITAKQQQASLRYQNFEDDEDLSTSNNMAEDIKTDEDDSIESIIVANESVETPASMHIGSADSSPLSSPPDSEDEKIEEKFFHTCGIRAYNLLCGEDIDKTSLADGFKTKGSDISNLENSSNNKSNITTMTTSKRCNLKAATVEFHLENVELTSIDGAGVTTLKAQASSANQKQGLRQVTKLERSQRNEDNEFSKQPASSLLHTKIGSSESPISEDTNYAKKLRPRPRLPLIKHAHTTMPGRRLGGKPRETPIDLTNGHEPQEIPESDQEIYTPPKQLAPKSSKVLGADDSEFEEVIRVKPIRKRKAAAIELKSSSPAPHTPEVSRRKRRFAKEGREGNGKAISPTTPVWRDAVDGEGVDHSSITVNSSSPEGLEVQARSASHRADEVADSDEQEVHKSVEINRNREEKEFQRVQELQNRYVQRSWSQSKNGWEPAYSRGNLNGQMPSSNISMGRYNQGGPQPSNSLGSNSNRARSLKRKTYDLKGGTFNASSAPKMPDQHSHKRQRIGSHDEKKKEREVIDIESETAKKEDFIRDASIPRSNKSCERRESSVTRSILSDDQHSHRSNIQSSPLAEYHSVEDLMNPSKDHRRKGQRNGTFSQPLKFASQGKSLTKSGTTKQQKTIEVDDISDTEMSVAPKRRKVDPETASSVSTSAYHGNANLRSPRPIRNRATAAPRETGTKSGFFHALRASASTDELDVVPEGAPPPKQTRKKATSKRSSTSSVDELTKGHSTQNLGKMKDMRNKESANVLLARVDVSRKLSAGDKADAMADTKVREAGSVVELDTDDETERKKSDITSSLPAPRSVKPAKKDGIFNFPINQVFPTRTKSLFSPSKDQWLVEYETGDRSRKDGTLTFINAQGQPVFKLQASSILKLDYEKGSAKLLFHSNAGFKDPELGNKLHVEFGDPAHCSEIRMQLRKMDPTVTLIDKTTTPGDSYLDRVFKHQRSHALLSRPEARPAPEVAQDLQVMQLNSERRAEGANSSRRMAAQGQNGNTTQAPRASGVVKGMLSRPVEAKAQLKGQSCNAQTIDPGDFYSGETTSSSASRRLRSHFPASESPVTRSSQRVSGKSTIHRLRDRSLSPSTPPLPELPRWSKENTEWTKNWNGPVVYPFGSKKQATVDQQDIQRLDEGEFLNDNIVNFYLRYLEHKLEQQRPDITQRIYFHNSYFYPTLTKSGRKGIDYVAVQRWTRKAGIMDKDYIVVPVCENLHWYVAIICNFKKLLETTSPLEEQANSEHVADEKDNKDEVTVDAETTPMKNTLSLSPTQPGPLLEEDPVVGDENPASPSIKSPSFDVDKQIKELSLNDQGTEEGDSKSSWPSVEETDEPKQALSRGASVADGKDVDEYPIASITSDIIHLDTPVKPAELQKQKQKQKQKKTIKPLARTALRDPTKPMIITLDSLGLAHSPTCVHLREYLIAEVKDKLGKDITTPSNLGLPARNIPGQDNHCDCGVYLLCYVEKFLESPNEFVKDVVSRSLNVDWNPNASEKREQLRNLLFELQKEVVPQATKSKQKHPAQAKQIERSPRESSKGSPPKPFTRETSSAPRLPDVPIEEDLRTTSRNVDDASKRLRRQRSQVRYPQPKSPGLPASSPRQFRGNPQTLTDSMNLSKALSEAPSPERSSSISIGLEEPDAVENQLVSMEERNQGASTSDDDEMLMAATNACTFNHVPEPQTRPRQRLMTNSTREEPQGQSPELPKILEHKVEEDKEGLNANDAIEIDGPERPKMDTPSRLSSGIGKHGRKHIKFNE